LLVEPSMQLLAGYPVYVVLNTALAGVTSVPPEPNTCTSARLMVFTSPPERM
jgi:hypothetical protein